jgi:hypothetical protein
MLLTLTTAKEHLRVTHDSEDAIITMYLLAAEQAAAAHLDRKVYADSASLIAAVAAAPAAFADGRAAYISAIDAARLLTDADEEAEALRVAVLAYTRVCINSRQTHDGIVVNEVISAAMLLTLGTLFAAREDVVIGLSVAQLPNGASMLLQPYRIGMGV